MEYREYCLYGFKESYIGKFGDLYELDEVMNFSPTKEYYRMELIVSDNTFDTLSNIIKHVNEFGSIDDLYDEDKPLSLKLIEAIKYTDLEFYITNFIGGEYFCELKIIKDSQNFKTITCNIEELLTLSILFRRTIRVFNSVINSTGTTYINNIRDIKGPSLETTKPNNRLDKLRLDLQKAIEKDDFESASVISKKIKEIEEKK